MWPLVTGLITGGASLLGSMFSSNTSAQNTQQQIMAQSIEQDKAEAFNASQSQLSRDFSSQMSNTAYQRASADMKAAGLNPMMMFGSGGAASTPSAPAASVGTPSVPMPQTRSSLGDLGANVRAGLDAAVSAKTFEKMTDEIANLQTQRQLIGAETALTEQRKGTETEETSRRKSLAEQEAFNVPGTAFQAQRYKSLLGLPQSVVDFMERGAYAGTGAAKIMQPFTELISGARGVRDLMPRRSTVETTNDRGDSSFSERWTGMYR